MPQNAKIEMADALEVLADIESMLRDLDGQSPESDEHLPSRERTAARAARSAKLLRASHEAKRLELYIMDEYHATRAQNRT